MAIKRKPARNAADRTALEVTSFRKREDEPVPDAAVGEPVARMDAPAAVIGSGASDENETSSCGEARAKQPSGHARSAAPQNSSPASIQSMDNISISGKNPRNRLSAHNARACITRSSSCVSINTTKITFPQAFVNTHCSPGPDVVFLQIIGGRSVPRLRSYILREYKTRTLFHEVIKAIPKGYGLFWGFG